MNNRTAATVLLGEPCGVSSPVRTILERAGLIVRTAGHCNDVLLLADPVPDLVLLDLNIPEQGGCQLCRDLKAQPALQRVPLILISDRNTPRSKIIECFDCGADDYLVLPVPEEELLARITARLKIYAMNSRWTNRLLQQQTEAAQTRIARLRAALEIAQLGIWELKAHLGLLPGDATSTTALFDDRCRDIFGLPSDRPLTLEQMMNLIHPDDRARVHQQTNAALGLHAIGVFETECRILRPDGTERWVAMRAHEVKSGLTRDSLIRFVGTLMDITERKRTQELLIRSERVAALGEMAATLAHEINNPLAAVVNTLYLARCCNQSPQEIQHYLGIADEELRRVSTITRRALGFYRENSLPVQVSIRSILDDTLSLLRSKFKSRNVVVEGRNGHDYPVTGVPGELRQVFSNLVVNSLDAVGETGTVKIRLASCNAIRNGDPCVRVTVADNGKGIQPSSMSHLFEPLFTTKGVGGTGLGLWVSKQIIEKHGGEVKVRSSVIPNRSGTVFSIFLPTVAAHAHPNPINEARKEFADAELTTRHRAA